MSSQQHAVSRLGIGMIHAAGSPAILSIDELHGFQSTADARGLQFPAFAAVARLPDRPPVAHGPTVFGIDECDIGQFGVFLQRPNQALWIGDWRMGLGQWAGPQAHARQHMLAVNVRQRFVRQPRSLMPTHSVTGGPIAPSSSEAAGF